MGLAKRGLKLNGKDDGRITCILVPIQRGKLLAQEGEMVA